MYCNNCGNVIPDGVAFCPACGAPAQTQQAQPQNPNAAQPQPGQFYPGQAPARQLNTTRSLLKFILLTIVTLGIYSIVYFSSVSESINLAASR